MKEKKKLSVMDDPDMQGVMPALRRALRRAHKIAHETNTGVVVMRDGKVVTIAPDPKLYGDDSEG